ncbi:hypothetical protein UFOVP597_51 [uncultured Caudovirales phage]|uniref:Uncharacterized protein n=1 Tax=uncultured Caudovirales phage TaxID=2100421 RepID=A0A6J5N1D6_9CAUD|nr:hypothetical protein UFOVP597_51 [uncultured Caudovirales phage]
MDEETLNNILVDLNEKQIHLKNSLVEAMLRSENLEEKQKIQNLLDFNEKVNDAIEKKDINSLQILLANANIN